MQKVSPMNVVRYTGIVPARRDAQQRSGTGCYMVSSGAKEVGDR